MKRFLLLFLSAPTVLSAVLPMITASAPAMAAQPQGRDKFCVTAHGRFVCVKSAQIASNDPKSALIARAQAEAKNPDAFINFSDKESDDAAAVFGCDCPACIRSLRQLRAMAQVN
ncbi:hypothetical protein [Chamaesiphon sp. VAR_69_metabat_338]|uniref:hypothetical protein n=1 Tax=Chamaesiphon sp. VAR_69_metabat_338 TaxID=2964704 RepID=UPI00286DC764|nr:hypothetical protein [Chamaesiphon sp. VAR_69_metabat_338]